MEFRGETHARALPTDREMCNFVEVINGLIAECQAKQGTQSSHEISYVLCRLESAIRNLALISSIVLSAMREPSPYRLGYLKQVLSACSNLQDDLEQTHSFYAKKAEEVDSYRYRVSLEHSSMGRPRKHITEEQVSYLRELGFTWLKIAELLGVSFSTLKRRQREFDLGGKNYTEITNEELDMAVIGLKRLLPNHGENYLWGTLKSQGIYVSRQRLRDSIHRVDPINTALRWFLTTSRRTYHVPCPNALWHIDSHMKLIRWGFVFQGGIDGFSRTIVYLVCNTNNRAATVYKAFRLAVAQWGVPARVRSDYGMENTKVALYMLIKRGVEKNPFLTGKSTHNQRIERLWREVHRCIVEVWRSLFHSMESEGMLDPSNPLHLFCLHFVFCPRINITVDAFVDGFNSHKVRTAHNLSPRQLWVEGIMRLWHSGRSAIKNILEEQIDEQTYGIDWEGPVPELQVHNNVDVPRGLDVSGEQQRALRARIDPLDFVDIYDTSQYLQALYIMSHMVQ
ncbi:uncharacterized protein LOC118405929 [Branchiostoma floridae]|uniref:Uncharacterized protein LOC118405929 n=1 Tax=Branchiostoma floridae TaxID=7739 RepID=A0A9J7HLC0_BRAFL|nr:uncharacterized protein LOC118405929 [Branchiostoma floridae]XP_035661676.1 uncharacterized protein LOC118405929 [Branchiostoma floridae]XP_035661677.1 uncharacterized protein LOC118405929 [Branchiostoma floridae]